MDYSTLYHLVNKRLTPMLPMTLPDLRAVITQPARLSDTVTDSTISRNRAITGWGGGIFNTGMLTLINSKVLDNTDDDTMDDVRGGGGILNNGTLKLINSKVLRNTSLYGIDGGIANTIKSRDGSYGCNC